VTANELADRRQRAREAFYDSAGDVNNPADPLEAAIETATRVQITPEMIEAFGDAWHATQVSGASRRPGDRRRAGLIAAFRAAGFEVTP
jgi:hypothetical protein